MHVFVYKNPYKNKIDVTTIYNSIYLYCTHMFHLKTLLNVKSINWLHLVYIKFNIWHILVHKNTINQWIYIHIMTNNRKTISIYFNIYIYFSPELNNQLSLFPLTLNPSTTHIGHDRVSSVCTIAGIRTQLYHSLAKMESMRNNRNKNNIGNVTINREGLAGEHSPPTNPLNMDRGVVASLFMDGNPRWSGKWGKWAETTWI